MKLYNLLYLQPLPFALFSFSTNAVGATTDNAILRFIRSLGSIGELTSAAAAPSETATTPYFGFMPRNPPQQARI